MFVINIISRIKEMHKGEEINILRSYSVLNVLLWYMCLETAYMGQRTIHLFIPKLWIQTRTL